MNTAQNKKIKKDFYNEIMEALSSNAEIVRFCQHEIDLINKKSVSATKKDIAKKEENNKLKTQLLEFFSNNVGIMFSIAELKECEPLIELSKFSSSKMSSLLKGLIENKQIVKQYDKKMPLYGIITPVTD